MHLRRLERVLTVIERTLRNEFPEDFPKRCAYAACGIRALLADAGIHAELVGGDFAAFVVSPDGLRAGVQGFGFGQDQCSHFWLETSGRLIDIGPYFLPRESSYPVVPMPAVAWDLAHALPLFLRYRIRERFDGNALMSMIPAVNERCERFVIRCRDAMQVLDESLAFPTWVVTGPSSVTIAANKKSNGRLPHCVLKGEAIRMICRFRVQWDKVLQSASSHRLIQISMIPSSSLERRVYYQ